MRWFPTPKPNMGDLKIGKKFAWRPTKLIDGSMIWFESYYICYEAAQTYKYQTYWRDIFYVLLEHRNHEYLKRWKKCFEDEYSKRFHNKVMETINS